MARAIVLIDEYGIIIIIIITWFI